MNYKVVYEITYFNLQPVLLILLIIIVILSLIIIRRKRLSISVNAMAAIIVLFVFCIIFETVSLVNHEKNVQCLKYGNCNEVEGTVENFIPADKNVKGIESFDVKGIKFNYTQAIINGGLNHSISNEIRNGSIVKIYYKNGVILKILNRTKN